MLNYIPYYYSDYNFPLRFVCFYFYLKLNNFANNIISMKYIK